MAISTGAALLGGSLLSGAASVYGANKQAKALKKAAIPYSVTGPFGTSMVDPKTKKIMLGSAPNPFADLFNLFGPSEITRALGMQDEFLGGVDPEVASAYAGLFDQGLTDRIQSNYDLLSEMAAPGEMSAFRELADRLYARTGLSTTGDVDRFGRFEEARNQADLGRQLQAIGLGRDEAMTRFEAAMKAAGLGQTEAAQRFGFGMTGFGGLQNLFQNLMQQAGLGTATTGAAAPAAMAAAEAAGLPWQAGMNFLNNSGLFSALGRIGSGGRAQVPFNLGAHIPMDVNIPFPIVPIQPVTGL